MKKLIITIIFFLAANHIFAQEITPPTSSLELYKHEIGVSYGAFAMPILIPVPFNLFYPIVLGSLNVGYYYNFNNKHSIGTKLSLTSDYFNEQKFISHLFYAPQYPYTLERWSIFSSLQLGYKMNYATNGNINFYFSLFAGIVVGYDFCPSDLDNGDVSVDWYPSIHLTLLGLKIGKTNCTIIEFGIGTQGLFQIGYQYRFNKNKKK